MKPVVGAIHELPLPQVLAIEMIAYHTCIQQRSFLKVHNYFYGSPNSGMWFELS